MSLTPMTIDSPIGSNGFGSISMVGKTSNGPPATAKVSDVISIYRPAKRFRRDLSTSGSHKQSSPSSSAQSSILSIAFDDEGGLLLTSESDNSMQIYNVREGKHHKALLSQKYGVMHAMFGHASGCIIHSSTKLNNTIRYLSTHDNSYLRYFEGHDDNVTCLSLHPGQDSFISCSEDDTLRIWDASTKNACAKLLLKGAYLASWDPSGNVFAVACPISRSILLYDYRNFDREPFSTFDMYLEIPASTGLGWNKLEFSNDGKHLLLGTTGNSHFLIDAFTGKLKASLPRERGGARRLGVGQHNSDHVNPHSTEFLFPSTGDCCFSPDGRYVLSGMRQQNILVWDTLGPIPTQKSLQHTHELEYRGDSAVVAFNPRYNLFATGDKEVVIWTPDMNMV